MTRIITPAAKRLGYDIHPYIPEAADQLMRGKLDRREFLRTSTLLGMSLTAATGLAGELTGVWPVPQAAAETPKKGGTLRVSMAIQDMADPAVYDWVPRSNLARFIVEHLTLTRPDNITVPYLAKSWSASDDLKTWTFNLNKGVTWSNGDEFNADDVVHTINRWLDPKTGSSNMGLFDAMVEEVDGVKMGISGAVEKVDSHTIRLHLRNPALAMPENFYNYPTAIMHRGFGVDYEADLSKYPIGTGPMELVDYRVSERAELRRKQEPWWYGDFWLDGIVYIDAGEDAGAKIAAIASDQVDMVYEVFPAELDALERLPDVDVKTAVTAQTAIMRMRISEPPFDNPDVRAAVVACMDHTELREIGFRGWGEDGENHHVAPIHPEYYKLPPLKRDIEKAKEHLRRAGYEDGLTISIDTPTTSYIQTTAEAFKAQCEPAGIDLQLNTMPMSDYWNLWDKTPFGITEWTHRPLGVMVLNLGYLSGVPWNETAFADPAFDTALADASATLDVDDRQRKMEKVEKILQDANVIAQPFWRAVFKPVHKRVRGFEVHPTLYHQFGNVWLDS